MTSRATRPTPIAPRGRRLVGALTAGLLATIVAACSDSTTEDTVPNTTVVTPDVTELAPPRSDDQILKIGVLLPRTGSGAAIGEPLIDVIEATIRQINDDGGVLGRPIRLVKRDEGTDQGTADLAANDLIVNEGVDAIIGPGSSRIAVAVAPSIVGAGVLSCSPLATSLLLSDLPDDGLFVRTIASADLQARAMARSVDATGFRDVSLVFPDDIYGRTFGASVRDALEDRNLEVLGEHSYAAAGDDFSSVARAALADEPPVIALIGDADNGGRLFAALQTAGTDRPLVIANDSIRGADITAATTGDDRLASLLTGVSLEPYGGSTEIRTLLDLDASASTPAFAAAAVDCVNLIALTALQSNSDDPVQMAALLEETTRGGTACQQFVACANLLATGRDIDYDGPTGILSLDSNGDVVQAEFINYLFDRKGKDTTTERFVITAG